MRMSNTRTGTALALRPRPGGTRLGWLAAVLLALSGCAALQPTSAGDGGLAIESVDSRNAHVGMVQTYLVDEQLNVSGYLQKSHAARGRIPGYLLIEAMAGDGTLLAQAVSPYHRRNTASGRAYFSETLPVSPEQVHRIRVSHHGLASLAE